MTLLAPLFLLGAIAIVGPIVFHLIRRTTKEKTPFSTLMFLRETPPRVTRRSRLDHLWLLLLRCLVIGLLAFAFARPFIREKFAAPAEGGAAQRTVVLLDTSASMRVGDRWKDLIRQTTELLQNATPAEEIALLGYDNGVRPVVTFAQWKELQPGERAAFAERELSALSPGWADTRLDAALLRAAEFLEEEGKTDPGPQRIVVISDLQEGTHLDGIQGFEWPRGTTVELVTIGSGDALANASLHWVADADDQTPAAESIVPRIRVSNAAASKNDQFSILWGTDRTSTARVEAYVPAGQSRIIRPPKAIAGTTALTLEGDGVPFDNTVHILPPQATQVPILFLGNDRAEVPGESLYYLRRAFPRTRGQNIEIVARRAGEVIAMAELQNAQMVVLGDDASEPAIAAARQAAEAGRTILAPLTSTASAVAVGQLLKIPAFAVTEAPVKDFALLGEIDFQHPYFAPFADPRFSDFTKIHFWKHRRIDPAQIPGSRVVARFDRGDPALVQVPLGQGSVVLFASSWRPVDSQLALSSKFVPLLHAMLEQSSNLPVARMQYLIGDEIALPPSAEPQRMRKPDGTEVAVAPGQPFGATDQPGIYQLSPGSTRFAVNLAPDESRLAPLPLDRFHTLGVPLKSQLSEDPKQAAARAANAKAFELEERQKLWRWLVIGCLTVLLLETLIAGKLSGPVRSSTALS